MGKKLLSFALSVCMIFGSAACLPENLFSEDLSIRSSASEQNSGFGEASNNIGDYWDDWYHEKYYDEDQLQDEKVGGDGSDEYKITKYTLLTCTATWLPHNYGYKVWVGDDDRGSYNYESHTAVCIGKRAFSISNLAEIDIEEGYTEIEDEAFYNCYSLKKIAVPKSVTKIGEKAIGFTDDGIKEDLTICCYKDSVAEKYAKDNNINYELITEDYKIYLYYKDSTGKGTIVLDKYSGSDKNVVVPSTYKLWNVFSIDGSFYHNETIESVTIPEGIKEIGSYTFENCTNLKSVKLPSTIEIIDNSAFSGCTKLSDINIPDSVKEIGEKAFLNCDSLTKLKLNNGLKTIGDQAFESSGLEDVKIPDSVTDVGEDVVLGTPWFLNKEKTDPIVIENAFLLNARKTDGNVVVPTGVKYICPAAFAGGARGTNQLTSVKIPGTVKYIGKSAFPYCRNLKTVTLEEGIEKIDEYAFYDCENLRSVSIPKSVTEIGKYAFGYIYNDNRYDPIKIDGFTIICYENSAAHKYAKENGFNVELNKWVKYAAKKPTCTKAGNIEYWKYGGKYYSEKDFSKKITKSQTVIPATGHKGKWVTTKKVTCTTDGLMTKTCTVCGTKETKTVPATGHDWGEPEWDISEDCFRPKAKFVCKNDSSHVLTVQGSGYIESDTLEPATCEKDGRIKMFLYAYIGGTQYKSFIYLRVPTSGHEFTNVKYTWSADYKTCTATGKCSVCGKTVSTTVASNYTITKAPTTSETGSGTYKAEFHNYRLEDQEKTVVIPKEALIWGTPTYKWSADGKSCTATRIAKNDPTKKETETSKAVYRVASTPGCSYKGKGEYTATFKNKAFTSQSHTVDIPSLAHTWRDWKITKQPTCTEKGSKERFCYYCNEKQTKEIAATGHKWAAASYSWTKTTSGYKCTATSVCQNDKSHKLTETAEVTYKVTKAPTTKATGTAVYTAVFKNSQFKTKTKTVTLAKEKYVWNKPVFTWKKTSSGYSCTATRTASNDKTIKQTETVKASVEITKAATCTTAGAKVYTATFKNTAFSSQKKTVTISAAGHKFSAWKTTRKATCTAAGTQTRKCTACGKTETKTIKATGHKFSAWKTTGYNLKTGTSTQTRKCSVCGKTEKQTTKNAINRLAGANRYETAAKLSSTMYKESDTVVLATGLTFNDALVAVPLAAAYDAPLLLGTERHITAQTEAELKRLKAKNVIVVSTNGAIGAKAKAELKALKLNTTYIEGKTCFETASKVAKALQKKAGKAPDTIFFATDGAFADALSASPVAAIKNAPIIYLKNKGSIDSATASYLKSVKGKVKNAYIIGGDGVISNAMMKNVAAALNLKVGSTVQRVAGKNRYETCVAVNKKFKSVLSSDGICVAKGLDFPDALAGGVYAAKNKQALFLADGKKLQDVQDTYLKSKNASKITVFGGTGAVPDDLVREIAKASV